MNAGQFLPEALKPMAAGAWRAWTGRAVTAELRRTV